MLLAAPLALQGYNIASLPVYSRSRLVIQALRYCSFHCYLFPTIQTPCKICRLQRYIHRDDLVKSTLTSISSTFSILHRDRHHSPSILYCLNYVSPDNRALLGLSLSILSTLGRSLPTLRTARALNNRENRAGGLRLPRSFDEEKERRLRRPTFIKPEPEPSMARQWLLERRPWIRLESASMNRGEDFLLSPTRGAF